MDTSCWSIRAGGLCTLLVSPLSRKIEATHPSRMFPVVGQDAHVSLAAMLRKELQPWRLVLFGTVLAAGVDVVEDIVEAVGRQARDALDVGAVECAAFADEPVMSAQRRWDWSLQPLHRFSKARSNHESSVTINNTYTVRVMKLLKQR